MAYEYTRENDLYEGVCFLIKKESVIDENGIEKPTERSRKEVFCKVGGIYQKEFFEAYQSGISAQCKIVVFAGDYENETIVELEGQTYNVYRKFPEGDSMELYLRKDIGEWS